MGEELTGAELALHVAFGRSDHFGGQVGAGSFSSPEALVHLDRVYIPELQPNVRIAAADLEMDGGHTTALMRDGSYTVELD